jgi:uncharacterized damage-inducible protein DinB
MSEWVKTPHPDPVDDERELLLGFLAHLRSSILRKLEDLDEEQARWTPEGRLMSVIGVVNHLTNVEQRWIDGRMTGTVTSRSETEFHPGPELTVPAAVTRYRERGTLTETAVRAMPLTTPARDGTGRDLRWVLLHMIDETARHAGHVDATRELLDGTTGV